ncbi:glycosyltransferase family 2 protein [Lacibacter luteus]|uniref:Glycosyltransferase family 2 protein n=1 Tax=Lacibacter luteus TaxID=2508719 RepID=A0A4Q1CKM8_9BACT|nr:glycosyltransferase family 2 protein [Lacibacter luteus]RXK60977.1 glycosyltransferase family 2 protein [Lacibacter luteus]
MQPISVVIITKNAAHLLAATLQSVKLLTDSIIVCDTGSNDATIPIAKKNGAKVIEEKWRGHGLTKNIANEQADYDWILQIDADEIVDKQLLDTLLQLDLSNEKQVFTIRRKNYFVEKLIRFGQWRHDDPTRLFNRNQAIWNEDAVHEKLICEDDCEVKKLKGALLHKTVQSTEQYTEKMNSYAVKSGEQYFKNGVKGVSYKVLFSPIFNFFHNYILRLGMLDGREGFIIALTNSRYTKTKYKTLQRLLRQQKQ